MPSIIIHFFHDDFMQRRCFARVRSEMSLREFTFCFGDSLVNCVHGTALVGRQGLSPLRIDLNTLQVTVSNLHAKLYSSLNLQLRDIVIANQKLYVSIQHVLENDLNNPSIDPKMIIGSDHMEQVLGGNAPSGSYNSGILIHDEWLVLPGYTWYRYNLHSEVTERLVPSILPKEFITDMGAYSSIHGLILWSPRYDSRPGRLHRVTILPE